MDLEPAANHRVQEGVNPNNCQKKKKGSQGYFSNWLQME
jgi:hypothetical protein